MITDHSVAVFTNEMVQEMPPSHSVLSIRKSCLNRFDCHGKSAHPGKNIFLNNMVIENMPDIPLQFKFTSEFMIVFDFELIPDKRQQFPNLFDVSQ